VAMSAAGTGLMAVAVVMIGSGGELR
jgi:hypothetical protein